MARWQKDRLRFRGAGIALMRVGHNGVKRKEIAPDKQRPLREALTDGQQTRSWRASVFTQEVRGRTTQLNNIMRMAVLLYGRQTCRQFGRMKAEMFIGRRCWRIPIWGLNGSLGSPRCLGVKIFSLPSSLETHADPIVTSGESKVRWAWRRMYL